MRINGKQLIEFMNSNEGAVPAFGAVNMEGIYAIIDAAACTNKPVILQMTEGGVKYGGLEELYSIAEVHANKSNANICIHLDHGRDLELIKKAIDLGFDSVMYDGSYLPIEENVANAQIIKEYIGDKPISLEVEIGAIGGKEDGASSSGALYANIDDVVKMNNQVNPDLIAVAVGTSHGIYKGPINIDYELLAEAARVTNKPLVLHGTSGVPDEIVSNTIDLGIKKVNYDTELKQAFIKSILEYHDQNPDAYDIRKIFGTAISAQSEIVKKRINLCEE